MDEDVEVCSLSRLHEERFALIAMLNMFLTALGECLGVFSV